MAEKPVHLSVLSVVFISLFEEPGTLFLSHMNGTDAKQSASSFSGATRISDLLEAHTIDRNIAVEALVAEAEANPDVRRFLFTLMTVERKKAQQAALAASSGQRSSQSQSDTGNGTTSPARGPTTEVYF